MKTLKAAMQTSVTDLQLEWNFGGSDKLLQIPSVIPPIFSGDRLIIYAINASQEVTCSVEFIPMYRVFQKVNPHWNMNNSY